MTARTRGHCKTCGKPSGYFVYCYAHRKANATKRSGRVRRGRWTMRVTGGTYEPLPSPSQGEGQGEGETPRPLVEAVGPVFILPATPVAAEAE